MMSSIGMTIKRASAKATMDLTLKILVFIVFSPSIGSKFNLRYLGEDKKHFSIVKMDLLVNCADKKAIEIDLLFIFVSPVGRLLKQYMTLFAIENKI
jgi:hypothetical protein